MPSTSSKKPLGYACMSELNKLAEDIPKNVGARVFSNSAGKLFKAAEEAEMLGDEERAYILYMKFFNIVTTVKKTADYKKDNKYFNEMMGQKRCLLAINQAEKLSDSLKNRYEEKEAEQLSRKLDSIGQIKKKAEEVKDEVAADEDMDIKLPSTSAFAEEKENLTPSTSFAACGAVSAQQLYAMILDPSIRLVLMDVRCTEDFDASHIKDGSCVNVPAEIVPPGCTVHHIESGMLPETKDLWTKRAEMDYVVLLDWQSSAVALHSRNPLKSLKDALYKWDQNTLLKSEPLILDGGYEAWVLCYPTVTTNPVTLSTIHKPTSAVPSLDNIDYDVDMNFLEDPKEKRQEEMQNNKIKNSAVNIGPGYLPSIDRSKKPNTEPGVSDVNVWNTRQKPQNNSSGKDYFKNDIGSVKLSNNLGDNQLVTNDNQIAKPQNIAVKDTNILKQGKVEIPNVIPGPMVDRKLKPGASKPTGITRQNSDTSVSSGAVDSPEEHPSSSGSTPSVEMMEMGGGEIQSRVDEKREEVEKLQRGRQQLILEHKARVAQLKLDQNQADIARDMKNKEAKQTADLMRTQRQVKEEIMQLEDLLAAKEAAYEVELAKRLKDIEILKSEEAAVRQKCVEAILERDRQYEDDEEEKAWQRKHEKEEETRLREEQENNDKSKALENTATEKAAQFKADHERASQEKAARERSALERASQERAVQEKAVQEKAAQERAAQERAAQERAVHEKAAQERAAHERALQKRAAQEKAAQERLAQEKAAQERAAQERAAQERAAQERALELRKEVTENKANLNLSNVEQQARNEANMKSKLKTPGLPVNWEKKLDENTGRYFYIDHKNHITQWQPPTPQMTNKAEIKQQPQMYKTKLKDEGDVSSNSVAMKRSHSSPNIAQMMEEEEQRANLQPAPQVNRVIKPRLDVQKTTFQTEVSGAKVRNLQPTWGSVGRGLTGLRNLGNTCYMNSTLQCMSNTAPLTTYFLSDIYRQDINRENIFGKGGAVAEEFSVVIKALWSAQYKAICPRDFKGTVARFHELFSGTDQQDSQELLLFLMDGLHEDLNRVKRRPQLPEQDNDGVPDEAAAKRAWDMHKSVNESIIVELFQGQFKSTICCLTCGKKSVTFDAFMYLSLPIPATPRCQLQDCIINFSKDEKMTGDSRWKCPRCSCKRDALKKIVIWKLPPILLIHLKRFYYQGMWRQKLTTLIDFPLEDLNLRNHLAGPYGRGSYNLYGVSNHYGSMEGGHYTAFCKNPNNQRWYKYDDHEVYDIARGDVKSAAGYILFYSSIEMKPLFN